MTVLMMRKNNSQKFGTIRSKSKQINQGKQNKCDFVVIFNLNDSEENQCTAIFFTNHTVIFHAGEEIIRLSMKITVRQTNKQKN